MNIKIKLPEGFLDEEVRDGYTITQNMKEVWAVLFDLFFEFKRVCEKHDIMYFADAGTILGGVRHNSMMAFVFNCYYTNKVLNYGLFQQIKSISPIFLRSIIAGLVMYFCTFYFDSNWEKLLYGSILGGIVYLTIAFLLKDSILIEVINHLKKQQ